MERLSSDPLLKDPIFALFSEHLRKTEAPEPGDDTLPEASTASRASSDRRELIARVDDEMRTQSAWLRVLPCGRCAYPGPQHDRPEMPRPDLAGRIARQGRSVTPGRLAHLTPDQRRDYRYPGPSGAGRLHPPGARPGGPASRDHPRRHGEDRARPATAARVADRGLGGDVREVLGRGAGADHRLRAGVAALLEKAVMRLKTTHMASPGHEEPTRA